MAGINFTDEREYGKRLTFKNNDVIHVVVESFYCNHDDGEYHNDPCYEQCRFCKEAEALQ